MGFILPLSILCKIGVNMRHASASSSVRTKFYNKKYLKTQNNSKLDHNMLPFEFLKIRPILIFHMRQACKYPLSFKLNLFFAN